jgi:hypothetical protein
MVHLAATSQMDQAQLQACTTVPSDPAAAVLIACEPMPEGTPVIRGYDFSSDGGDSGHLRGVMDAMLTTGFQVSQQMGCRRRCNSAACCLHAGDQTQGWILRTLTEEDEDEWSWQGSALMESWWRVAERRHPTRAARGWVRTTYRHFKVQSCRCLGSAFEVAAFQTRGGCVCTATTTR